MQKDVSIWDWERSGSGYPTHKQNVSTFHLSDALGGSSGPRIDVPLRLLPSELRRVVWTLVCLLRRLVQGLSSPDLLEKRRDASYCSLLEGGWRGERRRGET
jgi:hypothetical protein